MKNTIDFYLNGVPRSVSVRPDTTVLEMLRNNFGLNGIKEGCGEGDCGACTVVVGELSGGKVRYRPVVGCLHLAARLEGKHLITIEGLADKNTLHPIQQAVLSTHSTQCGFCTPGVILSLLALYLENPAPGPEDIRRFLEGNLCRCTGYIYMRNIPDEITRISVDKAGIRPGYLDAVERLMASRRADDVLLAEGPRRYFSPVSVESLKVFLKENSGSDVKFINGGTDVMVGVKKRHQIHGLLIDLSRIESLKAITASRGFLAIGGGVSLARAAEFSKDCLPPLSDTISRMCSEQVRSLATVAGNIANASPVADTVPLLMVLGAALKLDGPAGERTVPLKDFFQGYKKLAMKPSEWISSIEVPLGGFSFVNFEKATKRRELDISAVNSAIALKMDGGMMTDVRVACGGVGPVTQMMPDTAAFLEGKKFSEDVFEKASEVAYSEASPISDVRGSADYRRTMLKNFVIKHCIAMSGSGRKGGA